MCFCPCEKMHLINLLTGFVARPGRVGLSCKNPIKAMPMYGENCIKKAESMDPASMEI